MAKYFPAAKSVAWITPDHLLEQWIPVTDYHDPFPYPYDPAKDPDGYTTALPTDKLSFINPPFGNLPLVAQLIENNSEAKIVLVCPARPQRKYYQQFLKTADYLVNVPNCVQFIDKLKVTKNPASKYCPFPISVMYFNCEPLNAKAVKYNVVEFC